MPQHLVDIVQSDAGKPHRTRHRGVGEHRRVAVAEIYYRDTDPPDFAEYSHDPYQFSPNVEADLGPGRPWVLTVRLANPQQWAMVLGTSGRSPNPPTFHCSLAVDGVVLVTNSGAKGALCSLRHW